MSSTLRSSPTGRMSPSPFARRSRRPRGVSASNVADVVERVVRFSEEFFERLEELLPSERGELGTPSVTDFLLLELPAIRDRLATDYDRATLSTDDPDVRVSIGAGVLVSRLAVYATVDRNGLVEAFRVDFDPAS